MAANNISTLPNKASRVAAKLALAQTKRSALGTPGWRPLNARTLAPLVQAITDDNTTITLDSTIITADSGIVALGSGSWQLGNGITLNIAGDLVATPAISDWFANTFNPIYAQRAGTLP